MIKQEPFGAVFDESGHYRYRLWRRWDPSLPKLCFIMLNPSTADAVKNDPTISRVVALAQNWGYGEVEVVNLYAFRATSPRDLWQSQDPIGPANDRFIKRAVNHADACVLAWGNLPPARLERARKVRKLLAGRRLFCAGMTKSKQPRHPLYLPVNAVLEQIEA